MLPFVDPPRSLHDQVGEVDRDRHRMRGEIDPVIEREHTALPDEAVVDHFRDLNLQIVVELLGGEDAFLDGQIAEAAAAQDQVIESIGLLARDLFLAQKNGAQTEAHLIAGRIHDGS